jgi:hypothetical protein
MPQVQKNQVRLQQVAVMNPVRNTDRLTVQGKIILVPTRQNVLMIYIAVPVIKLEK